MLNLLYGLDSLIFYRDNLENPILKSFYALLEYLIEQDLNNARKEYFKLRSQLIQYIIDKKELKSSSVWKSFILDQLLIENNLTNSLLNEESFPVEIGIENDLNVFINLFNFDFEEISKLFDSESINYFNVESESEGLTELTKALESKDTKEVLEALKNTIRENGLGLYAESKIFKLDKSTEDLLKPVNSNNIKKMEDLIGYEKQKERLINNTKAFVEGKGGLNTLLYGALGTGKSTMIKALSHQFKDTPLRFIELRKEDISYLPKVLEKITDLNYPFIIFIDDLTFEPGDESYKILKNYLEGSFEEIKPNVLFYVTSNKRHLVTQSKSERNDAVNAKEVLEEKVSLASRFGLTIPFGVPNQDEYLNIVSELAKKNQIDLTEENLNEAIQWELRHQNKSGRTAEQFITYLKSSR